MTACIKEVTIRTLTTIKMQQQKRKKKIQTTYTLYIIVSPATYISDTNSFIGQRFLHWSAINQIGWSDFDVYCGYLSEYDSLLRP